MKSIRYILKNNLLILNNILDKALIKKIKFTYTFRNVKNNRKMKILYIFY